MRIHLLLAAVVITSIAVAAEPKAKPTKEQREQAAKSAGAAKERAALDAARAEYEKARANDPVLKQLAEAEKSAAAELDQVVTAKSADAVAAAAKQREVLAGKRAELLFRQGLLDLQLCHHASSHQRALATDGEVQRAAQAVADAEAAAPSSQVAVARRKLAEAEKDLADVEQRIKANPAIAAAQAKAFEAGAAARKARVTDTRLEMARKALDDARTAAFAALPEAKPFLVELDAVTQEDKKVDDRRRVLRTVRDWQVDTFRDGTDRETRAARAKTESAAMPRAVADAEENYRKVADATIGKDAEYQALDAKRKTLDATAKELAAQLAKAGTDADLNRLITEAGPVASQIAEVQQQLRAIRIKNADLDKVYHARSRAHTAAGDALQARRAAEKALNELLAKKAAGSFAGQWLAKELAAVDAQDAVLTYRAAVARYQLSSAHSPLQAKVEADAKVVAARQAVKAAEKEVEANPLPAVVAAEKASAEALAAAKELTAAQQKKTGYEALATAKRDAQAALRKAEESDPKRAALEKAKQALAAKREAKLAATPEGKELAAVEKSLDELEAEQKKANDAVTAARRQVAGSDDKEIVAAREKLATAQKALKASPGSPALVEAKQRVATAEKALSDKVDALLKPQ